MSLKILDLVRDELSAVEDKLQSRSPVMREMDPIGSLELTPLERQIRPGIVLLGARLFGLRSDKVVSLAAMVQFIHLARLMRENISELQGGEQGDSALAVLLGDYFYGRLLVLAVESGLPDFLLPLSEAVCRSAENTAREPGDPLTQTVIEMVRNQTADLFGEAMVLTGKLAEVTPDERETMRRFGLNLGMGYGFMGKMTPAEMTVYREEALTELQRLPGGPAREALRNVVHYIFKG